MTSPRTTRSRRSLDAERRFLEEVAAGEFTLAEGAAYKNSKTPVSLVCAHDHRSARRPSDLHQGQGCLACAGKDPASAKAAFLASVDALGAQLAEGASYVNGSTPVRLICAKGHACSPWPASVQRGRGICLTCAGMNPLAARASFLMAVAAQGGTLVEGAVYVNTHTPVQLICAKGHRCSPSPTSVRQGGGVCRACAGQDPILAEFEFLAALDAFGARLAKGAVYVDSTKPIKVICAKGHKCSPRPSGVQRGRGICLTCAGMDPAATKEAFLAEVAACGATLAEGSNYVKSGTPVKLICAHGHLYSRRPNDLQQGKRTCLACAGRDPAVAEASFLAAVAGFGAKLDVGAAYGGSKRAVRLICAQGLSVVT